jgi:hypothetical protein
MGNRESIIINSNEKYFPEDLEVFKEENEDLF